MLPPVLDADRTAKLRGRGAFHLHGHIRAHIEEAAVYEHQAFAEALVHGRNVRPAHLVEAEIWRAPSHCCVDPSHERTC